MYNRENRKKELGMTWEELESKERICTKCDLCQTRRQVLLGKGNKEAALMIVAEAPGEQEDIQGVPFVGRSGTVLDAVFEKVGMTREEIYITNIVKCHPPKNRNPKEEERELCLDWLRQELMLIQPKIICCLGKVAAERLIHPDFKITKEHGTFFLKNHYLFMATFHPSAILRDPSKKEAIEQDFTRIQKQLEKMNKM